MVDPRVLVIAVLIALGVYVGEQVVIVTKKVEAKVEQVVKATGHALAHGLKKVVGK